MRGAFGCTKPMVSEQEASGTAVAAANGSEASELNLFLAFLKKRFDLVAGSVTLDPLELSWTPFGASELNLFLVILKKRFVLVAGSITSDPLEPSRSPPVHPGGHVVRRCRGGRLQRRGSRARFSASTASLHGRGRRHRLRVLTVETCGVDAETGLRPLRRHALLHDGDRQRHRGFCAQVLDDALRHHWSPKASSSMTSISRVKRPAPSALSRPLARRRPPVTTRLSRSRALTTFLDTVGLQGRRFRGGRFRW